MSKKASNPGPPEGAEKPTPPPAPPEKKAATCNNTDRELFRLTEDDYYAPSIHVTIDGKIGIKVGGEVFIKSILDWHSLAKTKP